jgi:excisionase family DNA binding protein
MKVYSIREVAEILKLHYNTVMKLVFKGDLKHKRIGRQYRVSEEHLKEYIGLDSGENNNAKDEL